MGSPLVEPVRADALAPGRSIRYTSLDDLVVIMDLNTAHYFLLDEVATLMWQTALAAGTGGAAIDALAAVFPVDAERLRRDFNAFVASCMSRGFLERVALQTTRPPADEKPRRIPARRLLALRAWCALASTVLGLRLLGFGRWYRRVDRIARRSFPDGPAVGVGQAEAAFLRAENFFVLRSAPNDCLARSLSIFRFLSDVGLPARHCIGVRRIPLMMHAWVECGGRVVLDRQDCQDMTVVARLDA